MNKTWLYVLIAVLVVLPFIMERVFKNHQNKNAQRLIELLEKKDYAEFDVLVDSKEMQKSIPEYNLDMLKISSYQMRSNKDAARTMLNHIKDMHLNKAQEEDYLMKGFLFSVMDHDAEESGYYKDRIVNTALEDDQKKVIERLNGLVSKNDLASKDEIGEEIEKLKKMNPVIRIWLQ